ncbi:hypothetical protein P9D39_16270 [Heyndrickxia oleronia]|uniref:Uncharacterized protein n=1 Tax=Heyndrickxia oleronia TaxID=38875 RepID=A0A8E2I818_9BACI|nr:hypothetical protein [Heyndrickxia oleronia]MEC1375847.1 hypothetical protein [Heyndrickxia oleronia]OOP67710.1 hypothetical protein BWZ43_14350 [Heyndrickxia oleronia]QQZ05565.1 hypothetical protein I5818_03450 [Heyndrickxia oleronia]
MANNTPLATNVTNKEIELIDEEVESNFEEDELEVDIEGDIEFMDDLDDEIYDTKEGILDEDMSKSYTKSIHQTESQVNQNMNTDSNNLDSLEVGDGMNHGSIKDAMKESLEEATFNSLDIIPSISTKKNMIPDAGVLSVVNSNNGKRIAVSREVHNGLGNPMALQFGFINGGIVIGENLGDTFTLYELKKLGAKHMIYNKELVEQVTNHCNLDFTNCTSFTFSKVTYQKMNDSIVAIIGNN